MRTNTFGDPIPATEAELIEALEMMNMDGGSCEAEVFTGEGEEDPFNGPHATITDVNDPDSSFTTGKFPDKEGLLAALKAAEISLRD